MFRAVRAVAGASFRELLRERVFVALAAVAFFMAVVSVLLGEMTIDEGERLIADFSLFAAEACSVALALALGSSALVKEIERQTCLLVLARPISRFGFLLGKTAGLAGVLTVLVAGLTLTVGLLLGSFPPFLAVIGLSILLKSFVILAWSMAASNFVRPLLAFLVGLVLYLLGNWIGDLQFFARASQSPVAIALAESLRWFIPSFDLYNWKSYFHLVHPPAARDIIGMILQTTAWTGLGLGLAGIGFGRKDFV